MASARREADRQDASSRRGAFLRRPQVDKQGDEDEHEIAPKAGRTTPADGQRLSGRRRDPGRLIFRTPARQQRPQHASAVHGKRGQQIEYSQQQVADSDPLRQIRVGRLQQLRQRNQRLLPPEPERDPSGDQQIHRRPGQRDPQLFSRLRRPVRTRHAADGEHHDLDRADSKPPRHQRMAQLMQQDRSEQRQDVDRRARPGLPFADSDEQQEDEQQQEREVEADRHAEDREKSDRAPGERIVRHTYF